jgi:hypothetical protein
MILKICLLGGLLRRLSGGPIGGLVEILAGAIFLVQYIFSPDLSMDWINRARAWT